MLESLVHVHYYFATKDGRELRFLLEHNDYCSNKSTDRSLSTKPFDFHYSAQTSVQKKNIERIYHPNPY